MVEFPSEEELNQTALPAGQRHVLKLGNTFAIVDRRGDVHNLQGSELGLYFEGTRYLSRLALSIAGSGSLIELSAAVSPDNASLTVDLMNDALVFDAQEPPLPRGNVHVRRTSVLLEGGRYERLALTNFSQQEIELVLQWTADADFSDVFEVRGARRRKRGTLLAPVFSDGKLTLSYRGLDAVLRRTYVHIEPQPTSNGRDRLSLRVVLPARSSQDVFVSVVCQRDEAQVQFLDYEKAESEAKRALRSMSAGDCEVSTSDTALGAWIERSAADLNMMSVGTAEGRYVHAGVPWFSTLFGRDSLLTALSLSWVSPKLARGVLSVLAELQATTTDAANDAEPGKILHEAREGEMPALGEVPFARYYGSIDSTPLFVLLAAEYLRVSDDRGFIERLLPHVERALSWIDESGDRDGDGFVEYGRRSEGGLVQQGWKDSHDSVFHADGSDAEGPIALCEVQGYVYAAKRGAARIFAELGHGERAAALEEEARRLRSRFDAAFWCEDLGMYALALDGQKRPCRVRSSNAGHCLWTGIASAERAARLCREFLAEDMFSGWGVRTLSSREVRYSPLSYHNGSVWPHDTALVAAGLARYGFREEARRVGDALFALGRSVDSWRLPELICGFARRPGEPPMLYPVACAPQAWASGALYLILSATLGLEVDARGRRAGFRQPDLLEGVEDLCLRGLRVGAETLDVELRRDGQGVRVRVKRGPEHFVVRS